MFPMQQEQSVNRDIIVLGGSAGSTAPLRDILAQLPADFPASVFVVQHRAPSRQAETKAWSFSLPSAVAEDGAKVERSRIYVAPADRHLYFEDGKLRVRNGPRENMARPSIDVLFRSAAVVYGPRVVGVILSGTLDDGVVGLAAIKRCRGVTVVQDPSDALADELPYNALESQPLHRLPAAQIPKLLAALVEQPVAAEHSVPSDIALEAHAATVAMTDPAGLDQLAEPSHLTCPECQGPLWRLPAGVDEHYRCEVGHAYNAQSLFSDQSRELERALWVAYRTLIERARLLERLAEGDQSRGRASSALGYAARMREVRQHARSVLSALSVTEGWNHTDPGGGG
jgi:two-component system, chemotaxis family, protein-glutamate methylesterase/glutaminase